MITISSVTKSSDKINLISLSLITFDFLGVKSFKALIAFSAFASWITPSKELRKTTVNIIITSEIPYLEYKLIIYEKMADTISTTIIGFAS